jgi:aminopeptidase
MQHMRPIMEYVMQDKIAWSVVSMPIQSWAARVFPDLSPEEQITRLWDAIFETVRIKEADPVQAWKNHINQLNQRCHYLNAKHYAALHYKAPGTDLTVGLPDGHLWLGGVARNQQGIDFIPNLPTEEVFSLPHKNKVNGTVRASMPLSLSGKLLTDFSFTFQDGRVVDFQASENREVIAKLLETDDGARRLGEVALVPASSPIARSKLLFYNTLFDENAASHLALGRAYSMCLQGSDAFSPEEFDAAGGNNSLTHVDFMIGSEQMDIDGITSSGTAEAVMRNGEWAF